MKNLSLAVRIVAFLIFLSMVACTYAPVLTPTPAGLPFSDLIQAKPWPEADVLFRTNSEWLGSDDAYSINLGNDRVLWLFGDTFIAATEKKIRSESVMIRNSVGIQTGYDPSAASMQFYWRTQEEDPHSFFPEDNDIWFWPGHGVVIKDKLLIFLMTICSSSEGLGFKSADWRAVLVSNFEQIPSKWRMRWLETPENSFGLVVSGSVIQIGEYIYVFSAQEPGHTVHLVRWPVTHIMDKDLTQPQWWAGEEKGWVIQQNLLEMPQPLFSEGQMEFTVHYEPFLDQFLEIQTVGFGKSDLGFRLADSLIGRWTLIERFYRPEEYQVSEVMIYAAKAHPHLKGGDLVLTYATNSFDFARLVANDSLYYPRFLKASFKFPREK